MEKAQSFIKYEKKLEIHKTCFILREEGIPYIINMYNLLISFLLIF